MNTDFIIVCQIWLVCFPESKANFLFSLAFIYLGFFYLESIGVRWEKSISILVVNLNSGCSYLITAVCQGGYKANQHDYRSTVTRVVGIKSVPTLGAGKDCYTTGPH